jgi:hypothetical protein
MGDGPGKVFSWAALEDRSSVRLKGLPQFTPAMRPEKGLKWLPTPFLSSDPFSEFVHLEMTLDSALKL